MKKYDKKYIHVYNPVSSFRIVFNIFVQNSLLSDLHIWNRDKNISEIWPKEQNLDIWRPKYPLFGLKK